MAEPEPDPVPESMEYNSATQTDVVEFESDHTQTCKVTLKDSGVQVSTRTANVSSQTESMNVFSAVYLESIDKDSNFILACIRGKYSIISLPFWCLKK